MPLYEYRCSECCQTTERLAKIDDPPPVCEPCGERVMEKLISASSFQLKGTGWAHDSYGLK